jgi:hypothetical protein
MLLDQEVKQISVFLKTPVYSHNPSKLHKIGRSIWGTIEKEWHIKTQYQRAFHG